MAFLANSFLGKRENFVSSEPELHSIEASLNVANPICINEVIQLDYLPELEFGGAFALFYLGGQYAPTLRFFTIAIFVLDLAD